jgi:SAM-dependent methyltransferase
VAQYQQQERGADSDYERYLKAMDASMQQKVALTAAHLLGEGWLADMGMGSGTGTEALAALYPNIRVTGVDINPEMVERARERYNRENLDFRTGDIAECCFEPCSLDVIFNSSVIHHVTTFNDYDVSQAERTITNQVRQLKTQGNLIIRDFLRPEPGLVRLELPAETAELFERFAREFRFLRPEEERGFPYRERPAEENWRVFELESQYAVEFILRKDYTADWSTEVLEEYTYFTQTEFESHFQRHCLRILASTPIRNPWIIRNRFEGKFRLTTSCGDPLPFPPTNYLIVGEKVEPDEGVDFLPCDDGKPSGYLKFAHYKNSKTGQLRDLVRRPNATLDVVPYFQQNGELYVVARKSYPRPILKLCEGRLDGAQSPTYVTEPIVLIQGDKPLAQTVEEALVQRVGIGPERIKRFTLGSTTYPSPGGLQEEVRAVFVETEPVLTSHARERVRAVSARQLLRAAQVGGLPDSRLELHCFELLKHLGLEPGSWIGETVTLSTRSEDLANLTSELPLHEVRRAFQVSQESSNFLHLGHRLFQEIRSDGEVVREMPLEYVEPRTLSLHTVAVAPLWRREGDIYFGIHDDDFPAAQCFSGHSNLLVAPAWRTPKSVQTLMDLERFTLEQMQHQHGLTVAEVFTLGGPYFPSPGATPEVVYPFACDVTEIAPDTPEPLLWLPLSKLMQNFTRLRDGHLKVLCSRAARALGVG